jgi:hypothetical protein
VCTGMVGVAAAAAAVRGMLSGHPATRKCSGWAVALHPLYAIREGSSYCYSHSDGLVARTACVIHCEGPTCSSTVPRPAAASTAE